MVVVIRKSMVTGEDLHVEGSTYEAWSVGTSYNWLTEDFILAWDTLWEDLTSLAEIYLSGSKHIDSSSHFSAS